MDLLRIGFKPGKKLGEVLKKVELWWVKNNFTKNKDECLKFSKKNFYHEADGGSDMNIASIFPSVSKPNFVPRSYKRLNSTYLDLLKFWSFYHYHSMIILLYH